MIEAVWPTGITTDCVAGANVIPVKSEAVGAGLTANCPNPTIVAPLTGAVAVAVMNVMQGPVVHATAVATPDAGSIVATLGLLDCHCTVANCAAVGLAL